MKTIAVFHFAPAFDPDFGDVSEPMIVATLVHQGFEMEIQPYLDSGADMTVLPLRGGKRLGLVARGERPFLFSGEGGGAVPLIVCRVGLRIGASTTVPVRVGWAQTDDVSLLLGRLDVFDHFTFEFNHARQEIRVKQ